MATFFTEKGSHKSYFLYMHSLELLYSSYGEVWGWQKVRFLSFCHPSETGILFSAVKSSGKWWYILKIKFLPPFGFAKRWHKGCFSLYATARVNFGLFNSKLAKQMVVQGESLICLPPFSNRNSFFCCGVLWQMVVYIKN